MRFKISKNSPESSAIHIIIIIIITTTITITTTTIELVRMLADHSRNYFQAEDRQGTTKREPFRRRWVLSREL